MAFDILDERKELTQLLIDAHIMYGDKFVKEFNKMIEKKFPMNIKHTVAGVDNIRSGLRIVEKAERTLVLVEETA